MTCKHDQWESSDTQISPKTLDSCSLDSSVQSSVTDVYSDKTSQVQRPSTLTPNSVCCQESTFSVPVNRCCLKLTSVRVPDKASGGCIMVTGTLEWEWEENRVVILHLNYSQRWKQRSHQSCPQSTQRTFWTVCGINDIGNLEDYLHYSWEGPWQWYKKDAKLDGWNLWWSLSPSKTTTSLLRIMQVKWII